MAKKLKKHHHMCLRGKVWYFVGMNNRKRYHEPLSSDEDIAMDLRDQYLMEIRNHGKVVSLELTQGIGDIQSNDNLLLGEVAMAYAKHVEEQMSKHAKRGKGKKAIKPSTWDDYKSRINHHILPVFGNMPIESITVLDIQNFIDGLDVNSKTINNILVPMRNIFKYVYFRGLIKENLMSRIENLETDLPDIYPLSLEEVNLLLEHVNPLFNPFFTVAFYTGMRFGEMAGLKWKNVCPRRQVAKIRETLVRKHEGRPKTKKSTRDIDFEILPPVMEAFKRQHKKTGKGNYVFLDASDRLLTPDHVREVIWKKALSSASLMYRPLIQTRHTFATMMIEAGEPLGWIQHMMGHSTLQMLYTHYHTWINKRDSKNGSLFMKQHNDISGVKAKGDK